MGKSTAALLMEVVVFCAIVAAPVLICCMISIDLFDDTSSITVALNGKCCQAPSKTSTALFPQSNVVRIEPDFAAKTVALTVCNADQQSVKYVWTVFERNSLHDLKITKGPCGHICSH